MGNKSQKDISLEELHTRRMMYYPGMYFLQIPKFKFENRLFAQKAIDYLLNFSVFC